MIFEDVPGWSGEGEFETLAAYAARCPSPWVEIGSYCGRSAAALGMAAREVGAVVFAVDPHRGNPEMAEGEACHHPEVWRREHGSLSVLIDTVRGNGLEGTVVPVVGPGAAFAETGVRPGFVFIDADHSYEGCKDDWDIWSELLIPGGFICLHDADATAPMRVRDEAVAAGWTLMEQVLSLAVLSR